MSALPVVSCLPDYCGVTRTIDNDVLLRIDHCHATGVVRGVLCHGSNMVLGLMKDDPNRLRTAAAYIERHQAKDPGAPDEGAHHPV